MRRKVVWVLLWILIVGLAVTAADFPLTVSAIRIDGNVKIREGEIIDVVTFHSGMRSPRMISKRVRRRSSISVGSAR